MEDAENLLTEGESLKPEVCPEPDVPEATPAIGGPAPNGKSRAIGTVFAEQVLRVTTQRPDAYAAFLEEL
jgi:hypothetical protein